MPNNKILEQKKQAVSDLADKLKSAVSGVIVDYKGISVEDDTVLRRKMREAGVYYAVVKNTLMSFAIKEADYDSLDPFLTGTTALAVSDTDPVAPAKILNEYAKKSANIFNIKAGFVDGNVISASEVMDLAELPSKEVLVARALAGFNAPINGLVNVLNGNIRGLAIALNAICEQKSA